MEPLRPPDDRAAGVGGPEAAHHRLGEVEAGGVGDREQSSLRSGCAELLAVDAEHLELELGTPALPMADATQARLGFECPPPLTCPSDIAAQRGKDGQFRCCEDHEAAVAEPVCQLERTQGV